MPKLTIPQKRYTRGFYRQRASIVARDLLGSYLHRQIIDPATGKRTLLVGRIVETEAYGQNDEACHAFRGMTPRTTVLFGEAGFSYVYFTYGMYHCFNVSCMEVGIGEAVLIRALEPIAGLETMHLLRKKASRTTDLTSGPGKLCQAFGFDRQDNGIDLIESEDIYITKGARPSEEFLGISTRIGISVSVELPWRFFIKNNPFVSKGKPSGGF